MREADKNKHYARELMVSTLAIADGVTKLLIRRSDVDEQL